jgi:hypothetical protein
VKCGGNNYCFTETGEEEARRLLKETYDPNYYANIIRWAKGNKAIVFVLIVLVVLGGLRAFGDDLMGFIKLFSSNSREVEDKKRMIIDIDE